MTGYPKPCPHCGGSGKRTEGGSIGTGNTDTVFVLLCQACGGLGWKELTEDSETEDSE